MDEVNGWGYQHASQQQVEDIAEGIVGRAIVTIRPQMVGAIAAFMKAPIKPTSFFHFELTLLSLVREFGRVVLQAVVQSLEPKDPQLLSRDMYFECGGYRRRGDQTRNANLGTRFGNIVLWRRGYRSWQLEIGV